MNYILPIAAMLLSGFLTLMMLVFAVAGAANAGADQLSEMGVFGGGMFLLFVGCVIGSIMLMRKDRFGKAALVALLPTVIIMIILLTVGM